MSRDVLQTANETQGSGSVETYSHSWRSLNIRSYVWSFSHDFTRMSIESLIFIKHKQVPSEIKPIEIKGCAEDAHFDGVNVGSITSDLEIWGPRLDELAGPEVTLAVRPSIFL